jgi:hypothetical protein
MMTKAELEKIAGGLGAASPESWAALRAWIAARTADANENTTAEGEGKRDWWAGHERFGRDVLAELEDLRTGRWRQWAEVQALEEEEPEGIELKNERKGAKAQRRDEEAED